MVATASEVSTRQRLLDTTAELLVTEGVAGLSLREIARRAGVSHGAPLRHFPSLAALLSTVAAEGFARLCAAVDAGVAGAGIVATPLERLRAAGRAYVTFALANPGHFGLMFRRDLLDGDVPELGQNGTAAFDQLVDLVVAAQAAGWQPDEHPRRLAGAVWATVHGVASLWLQGAMANVTRAGVVTDVLEPALRAVLGPQLPSNPRRKR